MPTKYDVFAKLIEKGPCRESTLKFSTEVYVQLKELVNLNWVKEENNIYNPIKNKKTQRIFKIIKYCLKNNLDYNLFFSKNTNRILLELINNVPDLRPKNLKNNKNILDLLKYLEDNQFILVHNKRPTKGILLRHRLFDYIMELHKTKNKILKPNYLYKQVCEKIRKVKGEPINPFDENVFSFLTGSAQLEGATISIGETRDLLINDIYPNKPQKDIQMVKNLNEALHYILEHIDEEISQDHIKQINYMILFSLHRNAGRYKKNHNKIQGNPSFKTASPDKVNQMMNRYCNQLKQIKPDNCIHKIGYVHNELQHIHPFSDGNSRTTRIVLNWIMIKCRLPIIVLKMGCFDEYMKLTKLGKKRDDKELKNFFWNILVHEEIK